MHFISVGKNLKACVKTGEKIVFQRGCVIMLIEFGFLKTIYFVIVIHAHGSKVKSFKRVITISK